MLSPESSYLFALGTLVCMVCGAAIPAYPEERVKVTAEPMHSGRVNPMLFGNFVELLDDLVPGMWAEMLNDRSFEGLIPPSNWCYYDGSANICDREWDRNDTWTYDDSGAFNGSRSAKLTGAKDRAGLLTQSGLAVGKGAAYLFSGYLRSDHPDLRPAIALKALLPNGEWMTLATAKLPKLSTEWRRYEARLVSTGTSASAVFQLETAGEGNLWADKLSLMPSDNVGGWRKDVVEAIRDLKPAVIRWGGSVCDPGGYRWKDGIGDRDKRVPFPNKVWGRIDSNDVGIDEFCRFCELVDAEPLVCLSFSDGPQSAADLVQYCNGGTNTEWGAKRAANGHPEPYHVKYWQLGNELGGPDYGRGCVDFCKAIKAVDASAVLMSSFPSQELLDLVGKDIAYIGPHHYTPDLAECEKDFKNLSEMIRKTPGAEHIRIAVTEWNITAGAWGIERSKLLTLDCVLRNARYLNLMIRYSNIVDIACRSNMTNSMCSGVIETRPGGLLKRPSYYMMKLYADHAKPIPHAVAGAPENVDMAACGTDDGKRLCVFAVNLGGDPVELGLDLTGFGNALKPVGGEVLCDTQDRRQLDAMNHWTAPERVKAVKLVVSGGKVVLPAYSVAAIECE